MQKTIDNDSLRCGAELADEHDAWSLYNLILRRDPESLQVIQEKVGRPISELFADFLGSLEFQQTVLPALLNRVSGDAFYRGTQSFGELLAWAEARLPLPPELRKRLIHARSWVECDEILFSDPELLDRFPQIRDSGVTRVVEYGKAEGGTVSTREIRGGIDYANIWEVKGWCANAKNLQEKLTVDIFADNDLLGNAICRDYRRDIHKELGGDGHCGFTFIVPTPAQGLFQTERRLTIRERLSGLAIGNPIFVRGDLPRRIEAIDSVRDDLDQARNAIAKLETRLAQITAELGYPLAAYAEYARLYDEVTPDLAEQYRLRLQDLTVEPMISIVLMFRPDSLQFLDGTVRSIQAQIFSNWELVVVGAAAVAADESHAPLSGLLDLVRGARIRLVDESRNIGVLMREGLAQCSGDFVIFLHAGDRLMPDALFHNVVQLQQGDTKLIYADEDCYCLGDRYFRRHSPRLKPDLDLDYLLSDNYIGRFVLFERAMLAKIGDPRQDIPGAEEFDLVLRVIEMADTAGIVHLPRVLYHQYRVDDAPTENSTAGSICRAVNDYLSRNGMPATAEPHADAFGSSRPSATRVRWSLPKPAPKASLIIATKDHPELIGPCFSSLVATTKHYPGEIEILIVDNGTTDSIASALLRTLSEVAAVRTIGYPGPFNWSAMNNLAAHRASGDVLVLLNNDVLAISEGWLDELVSQAIRPEIGAVGARLLFADGTIQHSGMVLGVSGSSTHEAIGEPVANGGYLGRTHLQRRASAVTGACLATRLNVFMRMKGFDDRAFKVTYNDVDYCLKVAAAGLGVLYTPFATLYHFESISRGFNSTRRSSNGADEELLALLARWPKAVRDDLFYNPRFSRAVRPFAYLSPSKRR